MERQDFIDQITGDLDTVAEKLTDIIEVEDELRSKISDLELTMEAIDSTLSKFIEEDE